MAINIVDVYNVMYAGHFRFKEASVQTVNDKHIYTGGIYNLLRQFQLRKFNFTQDTWLFCFDRRTNRKMIAAENGLEYKGGRESMPPELFMQVKIAEKWLKESGFNVYSIDGFEADDIINTLAGAIKGTDIQVNIISADRDHAHLIDKNIKMISPNSTVPDVTLANYKDVVGKRGERVHYNSILLYKVIRGDSSDKIPSIKHNSYALYNKITLELFKAGVPYESLSNPAIISDIIELMSPQYRDKAKVNWEILKPRTVPQEWLDIKPLELNKEVFSDFLHLFGMKSILKKFGMTVKTQLPEFVMRERLRIYDETVKLHTGAHWEFDEGLIDYDFSRELNEDIEPQTVIEQVKDIASTNGEVEEAYDKLKNNSKSPQPKETSTEVNTEGHIKEISEDFRVED